MELSHIETDQQPHIPDRGGKGRQNLRPLLHAVALLQRRSARYIDVEEMEFLISVFDLAVCVDPDQGVDDFVFMLGGRFVDADVDGEVVFAGGGLEALDEGAAACGTDRGDGFGGGGRDVIGCFGEEEGLGFVGLWSQSELEYACMDTGVQGRGRGAIGYTLWLQPRRLSGREADIEIGCGPC